MWQAAGRFVSCLLILLLPLRSQCQPDTPCVPHVGPGTDIAPCCAAVLPALFETLIGTMSNLPLECQAQGCRCVSPPFTPQYAADTLRGKTVMFLGDSTVRLQYFWLLISMLQFSNRSTEFWVHQPSANVSQTISAVARRFKDPHVPGERRKSLEKGQYVLWHEWDFKGVRFRLVQDWWPDPTPMRRYPHDGWVAQYVGRFRPDILAWNIGMHAMHSFPYPPIHSDVLRYWQQTPLPSMNATAHAASSSVLRVWLGTAVPNVTMMHSPYRERITEFRKHRTQKCRPAWFCDRALRDPQGGQHLWRAETAAVRKLEGQVDMVDNFRLSEGRGELSIDGIHYTGLQVIQMRMLITLVHVRLVACLAGSSHNKTSG